jgi:putative phosphoesterase
MRANTHTDRTSENPGALVIGVLSDTHGHLDDAARQILSQTDLILHAGDIDRPVILDTLKSMKPVVPVRGNMDGGPWARQLAEEEFVEVGPILIYLIHDRTKMSLVPEKADIRVVVSGHTHRPEMENKKGVLYLNPGSASFPRGGHPASLALLEISGNSIACRHIAL